jgi:hypothetical protein
MTLVASGPLKLGTIAAEYGAAATNQRLGSYYRGHASKLVRKPAVDSGAVSDSANVPLEGVPLQLSKFYSQGKGFTYTNTTTRLNNYYPHGEFGSDWLNDDWPKKYINNAVIGATTNGYYACILYGGLAPFTFTNNSEIQGGYGPANAGAGQHAIYLYNSTASSRITVINNYGIRGGGGGGGAGGAAGAGGPGYYYYTAQEVPGYQPNVYHIAYRTGGAHGIVYIYWGGLIYSGYMPPQPPMAVGAYTYYQNARQDAGGSNQDWSIYRQWTATAYTSGGGGGGGGYGGNGAGYGVNNAGGGAGAAGAPGGVNAGAGGAGGIGGTGGYFGANGNTGNTGATGAGGNNGGGGGGVAGAAGGPGGYCVYAASVWSFANYNTINGPYGGGVAPT